MFVQIGEENVHLVRSLLDEVFGSENFVSQSACWATRWVRMLATRWVRMSAGDEETKKGDRGGGLCGRGLSAGVIDVEGFVSPGLAGRGSVAGWRARAGRDALPPSPLDLDDGGAGGGAVKVASLPCPRFAR